MALDINELNKEYSKEKTILDNLNKPGGLKDKIEQMENDLLVLIKDFKIKQVELEFAQAKKDKAAEQTLNDEIKAIKEDLFNLRDKLMNLKKFLLDQQNKVNSKLEELSKDPETKQKLDEILYKRYDRKRKIELDKKQQLEKIMEIVDNHPNVRKWIDGIEGYGKLIQQSKGIIKQLGSKDPAKLTPNEANKLAEANKNLVDAPAKINDRRKDLVDFFEKNHPEINKEYIENIKSYGNIKTQIIGCEKSIANYDRAMENLSVSRSPDRSSSEGIGTIDPPLPPAPVDKKPSWLHPIKRIKYMLQERKKEKTDGTEPKPTTATPKTDNLRKSVKLSKEEYNAEIVQKYLEQFEKGLHDAAVENRKKSKDDGLDK